MTHTETTRESARHLEQSCHCLAALAKAMSNATAEECKRLITEAIRHALGDVSISAGAVFRAVGEPTEV